MATTSTTTGIHWGGSSAVLGGVLWALWYVGVYTTELVVPRYDGYEAYNRLMPFVLVLLLAGLTGAYAQLRRSNKLAGSTGLDLGSAGCTDGLVWWALSLPLSVCW